MPAKNLHHDVVRAALIADGWTITDDPLWLQYGGRDLYLDLAAERNTFAAEKEGERIAVEVQSFAKASDIRNLQEATGQYGMYRVVMRKADPQRALFMAVACEVFEGILSEPLGQEMLAEFGIKILIFDPVTQRILRWIP